jgi:RNA polymerase sigma factor (sigma-70 family)
MSILDVVFLLLVANGAPILTDCLFRSRLYNALDAGFRLADGRPLFGTSKTVRGIAGAIVATSGAAVAIGYSPAIGLLVSAVAMFGDLTSSFIKRRLALAEGSRIETAEKSSGSTVEKQIDSASLQRNVRHSIDQLPDDYRVVLLLRDIDGLNTRETADILGIQLNAVKTRLHRARSALRYILQPVLEQIDYDADM